MADTEETFNSVATLWAGLGMDEALLDKLDLVGDECFLASSFKVSCAAQASIALAALSALALYEERTGKSQRVTVRKRDAELECTGLYTLDGAFANAWGKYSGLYRTADGHIRLHANFDHHRDGALKLLGLPAGSRSKRSAVEDKLLAWQAVDFEDAAAERGLVAVALRSFEEWQAHCQSTAAAVAPVKITRTGDGPPRALPPADAADRPLSGIRALELTRILAGPVCGRTLAGYGADVMLVNSPSLPNIAAIVDTSRGKRSTHLDLKSGAGRDTLERLLAGANVFIEGYRPGALAQLGFSPERTAAVNPGIVHVSLAAYAKNGPWAERRGFDSLVQSAMGFNLAEAEAMGSAEPRAMPVQILDYASGFLMAFGACVALCRQLAEGGSWHVEVSLQETAEWLKEMGRQRVAGPPTVNLTDHMQSFLQPFRSAYGKLKAMPHGATFSGTPVEWRRPSAPPGTDKPDWGEAEDTRGPPP